MPVIRPDTRFATGFLNKKHKQFAELGEVIQDDITGEILLKRKGDGKIISFVQNDKYIHDIIVELKILMKNHIDFKFPNDESSWFHSSDYNINDIMGDVKDLVTTNQITLPISIEDKLKINLPVSKKCNGFFIKPTSRDTDKALINYMTGFYDSSFKNYSGTDPRYIEEKDKFSVSGYLHSNVLVNYTVKVTGTIAGTPASVREFSDTDFGRINESKFMQFPDTIFTLFEQIDKIEVTINSFDFPKFKVAKQYMGEIGGFDTTVYDKLKAPDGKIALEQINVMVFVDNVDHIPLNDNVLTIALLNSHYIFEFLGKVDKLSVGAGLILSSTKPTPDIWSNNNGWAEAISKPTGNGKVKIFEHVTDMKVLESFIYNASGRNTRFTFNPGDVDDIYIERDGHIGGP